MEKATHRGRALASQFLMAGFGLLHPRTLYRPSVGIVVTVSWPRDTGVVGKDWGEGISGQPSVFVCTSCEQQALL